MALRDVMKRKQLVIAKATMTKKRPSAAAEVPPAKKTFSLISDEKLLSLYAAMIKCRMLDERLRGAFAGNWLKVDSASAAVDEAALVGVAIDLLAEDTISPSNREFTARFVKGAPLAGVIHALKRARIRKSPPLAPGSVSLIATGLALANRIQDTKNIAVAFLGGESAASGSCTEALHFAGVNQLPILFVSHNSQQIEGIDFKTIGVPCITVDGNDVVAVYRVACEAITHARKGNGPTLIECKSFALHGGKSRGPSLRKQPEQAKDGSGNDPIVNMETYLAGKGLFRKEFKGEITAAFTRDLDAALESAERQTSTGKVK
jgi:TPP-dependent pyruvate/acetoin dehydrogenase alpha subunit